MSLAREKPRLIGLVWPFVAVVLVQAAVAALSLYTLSAVRAYVGGESLWSKGQKDAIHFLHSYAETGDERDYFEFKRAITIPLGDRTARLALEGTPVDLKDARQGLLQGGNHEDDVSGMIWLFRNFRNVSYLDTSITVWATADPVIVKLDVLGDSIYRQLSREPASVNQIAAWQEEIDDIGLQITPLALAFSQSLSEGSRAITRILLAANVAIASLLIALAVWRTRKLLRQRRAAEAALHAEKQRAQTTLSSIGEAVVTTDAGGAIDYLNPAAELLFCIGAMEARGRPLETLFTLLCIETGERDHALLDRILAGENVGHAAKKHRLKRRDGTVVAIALVGAPLREEGRSCGAVLVFHDMTREQEFISRLSWQATHDALTDLANRRMFEEQLAKALAGLSSHASTHVLMYLDLDQFKLVNDTCGHAAGDSLLQNVSARLLDGLRPADLLARLGGDEFGVLMSDCKPKLAAETAERLRKAIEQLAFSWNGRLFNISVSIGVVQVSDAATTLEEALQAADVACYMAKEKGRNRVQIHEPGDSEVVERVGQMAWVQRIRHALDEDRFTLFAQEIVSLQPDRPSPTHVELLLKLYDEDGVFVQPSQFIPVAERYGLMPLIDRWVVRHAFTVLGARRSAGMPIDVCAINISGASFNDEGFVDFVRAELSARGVVPQSICFEITETSAIANLTTAISFIGALRAIGCRFALDDFGSGMSSFSYLKHLPVDYLKIDGGFVKDMLTDRSDRAMVEMIQHVGHVMDKITIAEWVESAEIAEALRELGIDYGQGFALARPAPFDENYRLMARLPQRPKPAVEAWPEVIERIA